MNEFTLPEWASLDAVSHLGNELDMRTVILHIRSMTVIEIFDKGTVLLNEDVLYYSFNNTITNEPLIAALHFSTTIESKSELKDILKKCAIWYCSYSEWEDSHILGDLMEEGAID